MPKTFHFQTTFDTKVVIQDADLEVLQKYLAEIDAGTSKDHLADQKRTGMGQPLDQRIALLARATLRNGVSELLPPEYPEGYSFSPAKVTQVVIPRIEEVAKQVPYCGDCGRSGFGNCECPKQ